MGKHIANSLIFAGFVLLVSSCNTSGPTLFADLVVMNAKIYTMDGSPNNNQTGGTMATAMCIHTGRITWGAQTKIQSGGALVQNRESSS